MRIIYFGLKLLWIPPTVLQECESPIPRWTEVVYDKCQDYGRWQLPTYEYESKWVSRMNEGKLIYTSRWAHLVRTCKIKIQYSNFPHMKSLTLLLIPLLFLMTSCTNTQNTQVIKMPWNPDPLSKISWISRNLGNDFIVKQIDNETSVYYKNVDFYMMVPLWIWR